MAPTTGDGAFSSMQVDAVTEEVESCSAVHLPHDLLGSGIAALGPAVVVGPDEGPAFTAARSSSRPLQKLCRRGEGEASGADGGDPLGELVVVALGRRQERGELVGASGELNHLRSRRGEEAEQVGVLGPQLLGVGEQEPGDAAGECHGAVAFSAALIAVADQQIGTAGSRAPFPSGR